MKQLWIFLKRAVEVIKLDTILKPKAEQGYESAEIVKKQKKAHTKVLVWAFAQINLVNLFAN